jgi:hypothetical protein
MNLSELKKTARLFIVVALFAVGEAFAIQVEKNADTAAAAKNLALAAARRMEFAANFGNDISVSDAELVALVDSVSIENEKSSTTSYSADISVKFDKAAVNAMFESRGLQNPMPLSLAGEGRMPVFFESVGGLNGLAAIMRASRETGADLKIVGINDGRIFANVRSNFYQNFVSVIRSSGVVVSY